MSNRIHRVTHPILGVVSWREIQKAQKALRAERGHGVCSWCHGDVPNGCQSRCRSGGCIDAIWRAYSWQHCSIAAWQAANGKCVLCGNRGREVDHILPVCEGGTGDVENLRLLCVTCHAKETKALAARRAVARREAKREAVQIVIEELELTL